MNIKSLLSIYLLCIFFQNISAQKDLFTNYKTLEPSGEIPKEFITKSSERVQEELDDFVENTKGKTKAYKTDFLISSTFSTHNVLLSGKVLYNDPVTKYINKVANEIFKANKELDKSDFRIYAYKSPIVNAFAFNDGLVLVNLGLIAQLENEAQLAWILSHEFTHVVNEDAIDNFLENKNIEDEEGIYKNTSYDDKKLFKSKYSQEIETTADLQGLEYYRNTKYSMKPVNGVFDVLKYSYLPFDDIAFDTTYFGHDDYIFPSEYKLKVINPISPDGLETDEDEEILKSHPDAEERREAALDKISIAEIKDESRQIFLASNKEEFERVRNICRFEMPRMYVLYGYYEMAFYNVYLLEKQGFENNIYLDRIKVNAISQMARKVNGGERPSRSRLKEIEEELQGESQQVYFFLNKMARNKKEFNVFATQYTYSILLKHPDDEAIKACFENIAYQMFSETSLKFSKFKGEKTLNIEEELSLVSDSLQRDSIINTMIEKSEKEKLMDEIRAKDSKYKKIEKKVKEEKEIVKKVEEKQKKEKESYYQFAFTKYMKDKSFRTKLKQIEKDITKEKNREYTERERDEKSRRIKLNRNRGFALGIEKVVVVNPMYYAYNKKGRLLYKTEKGQENLNEILAKIDRRSKLDVEVLDIENSKEMDTENFINATVLNDWVAEQFLFDKNLEYSSIEKEYTDNLIKKFDTKYYLWTGVISSKSRKNYTYFFNILFDLETGKAVFKSYKNVRSKANKNLIKSELYYIFNQINFKRNK